MEVSQPATTQTAPLTPTTPATEAPKTDPAQSAAAEAQRNSSHFAAIARREKAIQERERLVKEKDARYADYEAREKARREDPDRMLQDYGYTLDDIVKRKANGGKLTPEMEARKAMEAVENLRKEREEERKAAEKAAKDKEISELTQREQEAVQGFLGQISTHMKTTPEKFELIMSTENPDNVIYNVVDKVYKSTGKIMTAEEAADYAEAECEKELEKLFSLKKVQSKFAELQAKVTSPPAPGNPSPAAKGPETKEPMTLSQGLQSQSPPFRETPVRANSANEWDEEKRKAASLLKWGPNT